MSFEKIKEIVERNDKKRYMLETEEDGRVKIKACQGHSMEVCLFIIFRFSKLKYFNVLDY